MYALLVEAEIFWFVIAFYNLYFKEIVSIADYSNEKSVKAKLARGILTYE